MHRVLADDCDRQLQEHVEARGVDVVGGLVLSGRHGGQLVGHLDSDLLVHVQVAL